MKPDYLIILLLVAIILIVVRQIQQRLSFSRSVMVNDIILIKYRNYRTFSPWGILFGAAFIIVEIWRVRHSFYSHYSYVSISGALIIIIVSVFNIQNYVTISKPGIDVNGQRVNWNKIEKITGDEKKYVIVCKKKNIHINYSDLVDFDEFKKELFSVLEKYQIKNKQINSLQKPHAFELFFSGE